MFWVFYNLSMEELIDPLKKWDRFEKKFIT